MPTQPTNFTLTEDPLVKYLKLARQWSEMVDSLGELDTGERLKFMQGRLDFDLVSGLTFLGGTDPDLLVAGMSDTKTEAPKPQPQPSIILENLAEHWSMVVAGLRMLPEEERKAFLKSRLDAFTDYCTGEAYRVDLDDPLTESPQPPGVAFVTVWEA